MITMSNLRAATFGLLLGLAGIVTTAQASPIVPATNPPCPEPGSPANTVCIVGQQGIVTNTNVTIDTVTTTQASATVNQYQTEFVGFLQGGPALYDQTFDVAFGDPTLASELSLIEAFLSSQSSNPLSFSGPTLNGTTTSSSVSSDTVIDGTQRSVYTGQAEVFGPLINYDVSDVPGLYHSTVTCTGVDVTTAAIPATGPDFTNGTPGQGLPTGCTNSGPYFVVLSGQADINIYLTTVNDTLQTTTDTTTVTTRQIFDIVGTPQIVTVTVPEPVTFSIFGAGLIGAFAMRGRRKKANA